MTREDALNKTIGILTYHQVNFCKSKEAVANMNEIIEALEKIDQEPCGDAVSRQAVIDTLTKTSGIRGDALKALYDLPSVTPQPKMGHWVKVIEENGHAFYLCSVCKEGTDENYDWCPFCGCKMQEVE